MSKKKYATGGSIPPQNIPELTIYGKRPKKTSITPAIDPNPYRVHSGAPGMAYYPQGDMWVQDGKPASSGITPEQFNQQYPNVIHRDVNYRTGQGLPEYSAGGIFTEMAAGAGSGALAGTMGGGPIGTVGGAIIGGAIGLTKGIFNHVGEKRDEREANEAQTAQIMDAQNSQLGSGIIPQRTFEAGGIMPGMAPTAELEKEEVTMGPDGSMAKMNLPSHAQGGGDVPLEPGTKVYSDKYKPQGSKMTYAEEADAIRKQIKKLEKKLYA